MRFRLHVFFTVFIFASAALTMATPSTQIWIPSTDIQAFMNPHIGWDAYVSVYNSNPVAAVPMNGIISNGGITIGLLPSAVKAGAEIGIDFRDLNGNHMDQVYFNAKAGLPEDAFFKYMPALAVGIYDLGIKSNFNNYDVTYGLLAKTIWKLGRFSVGGYYGAGPDALWLSSAGDTVKAGVLASWDRTISEISDKLWLAIDYQGGNNGYGAFSFGLAWLWAPNVSTILGYDIFNDKGLAKPTITFQVDINMK